MRAIFRTFRRNTFSPHRFPPVRAFPAWLPVALWIIGQAGAVVIHHDAPVGFDNFFSQENQLSAVDLTGDGTPDLQVYLQALGAAIATSEGFQISGVSLAEYGYTYPYEQYSFAMNFGQGSVIGSEFSQGINWFSHDYDPADPSNFYLATNSILMTYNPRNPGVGAGGWWVANDGYTGFRFLGEDGAWHYGWLRIRVAQSPITGIWEKGAGQHIYFYEWAWETEPDTPIATGAIPEPAVPGLVGIAGTLLVCRRRRGGV